MFNKKKSSSTRQLINTKTISDYSLRLFDNEEIVFFIVQPQNLSVMSRDNINSKIFALTNVLKGLAEMEMICLNSRDNFEENKIFLKKRIEEENNPKIIKLLEEDLYHLDKIQIQTATARLFLLALRIKQEEQVEVHHLLQRIEKLIKLQNLNVKRARKEDIKNMLAVYFEQNVTTDVFEDIDGERWLKEDV
jgi:hypothetical protein